MHWPEDTANFREVKIDENVRSTLRYDRGREAVWPTTLEDPTPTAPPPRTIANSSMFFFRWEPGTTSILRARAHRPDVCLPNTGWRVTADLGVRLYPLGWRFPALPTFRFWSAIPGTDKARQRTPFSVSARTGSRKRLRSFNLTAGALSDWGRSDRLRVVLDGVRNQGQQVLEVVLTTPHEVTNAEAEAWFAQLAQEIVKVSDRTSDF